MLFEGNTPSYASVMQTQSNIKKMNTEKSFRRHVKRKLFPLVVPLIIQHFAVWSLASCFHFFSGVSEHMITISIRNHKS
jgi:hypothetical protein